MPLATARKKRETPTNRRVVELIEGLTGQQVPLLEVAVPQMTSLFGKAGSGLGHSQFNELLLLLGYDRVTDEFFQYLTDGTLKFKHRSMIKSVAQLAEGADRVRQMSLQFFGNVKYGFKVLSRDPAKLAFYFAATEQRGPKTFMNRHEPVHAMQTIPGKNTFYLGYLIENELKERLRRNPDDVKARAEEQERRDTVEVGKRNLAAYLASDHLDVYVATSMRERHEYLEISRLTHAIFGGPALRRLKLRWFDPTQAYCKDRIDKGLAEGLMLKRAKCTLYLAQEVDTLGKDSELASTLAQGKPVIAFVPKPERRFVETRIRTLKQLSPEQTEVEIVMSELQLYKPKLAWTDSEVRGWLENPGAVNLRRAKTLLVEVVKEHYDKRASVLHEVHPLAIQVNLATGVANGLLVARTVSQCAKLIRQVVTRGLKFEIERTDTGSLYLRERVSKSIYRVMTSNAMLANAFWNFYLEPSD